MTKSTSVTLSSEQAMINFGEQLAKELTPPAVLELIGDVGTGKTTITKGIAQGLVVTEEVTSPSFTISKQYSFPLRVDRQSPTNAAAGALIHYDFYRLTDPGIMRDDLLESVSNPSTITVVEWADSVAEILPEHHRRLIITYNDDGSRTIQDSATPRSRKTTMEAAK